MICRILLTGLVLAGSLQAQTLASPQAPPAKADFGKLPLAFEQNRGQAPADMQFVSRTPTANLYLGGSDAYLQTVQYRPGQHAADIKISAVQTLRMHLAGAAKSPHAEAIEPLPGVASYMNSNDRSRWASNLPTFGRIKLDSVYNGIDLIYYGTTGKLEYDFVVSPNADPSQIKLDFEGAKAALHGNHLVLQTAGPQVTFDAPVSYQQIAGQRRVVDSSYHIAANGEVSFHLGAFDHSQPLIIDPQVVYTAELGTGNNNNVTGKIVVDSSGALYLVGTTLSYNFPVTPGAFQSVCGPAAGGLASSGGVYCGTNGYGETAAYVSKISADGSTLLYSTYLSGHLGGESGASVAVDSTGIAYVLGNTSSDDFPITSNAFQTSCLPSQPPGFESQPVPPTSQCNNYGNGGGTEYTINGPVLFFAKLNPSGTQLLYSSFLGGSFAAYAFDTALDNAGNWYLFGQTSLDNSSDLYGNGGGHVQFTGFTSSGFQTVFSGAAFGGVANVGVFLSEFNNAGTKLLYGTWYGDLVDGINVQPQSFAVGQNGIVYTGGYTSAVNLPTTSGTLKPACVAGSGGNCNKGNGFLAEFDTTKSGSASLAAATFIGGTTPTGGSTNDLINSMKTDAANNLYFTGYSQDMDFPTTSGSYSPACPNPGGGGCNAAVVVKMPPGLAKEVWGTWIGDTANFYNTIGNSIAVDPAGNSFIMGQGTEGTGFPCVNCFTEYTNSNIIFAELSASGAKLLWATFFGNAAENDGLYTQYPIGLTVDAKDNVYWFGSTNDALSGATPGAYQTLASAYGSMHTIFGKISSPTLDDSTTAVTVTPSTVTVGTNSKLSVTVTGSSGTPTGTAALYLDGVYVESITLTKGTDSVEIPTTDISEGKHAVGVIYSGDSVYSGTTTIVSLTVNFLTSTTTLAATPAAISVGQPVTLKATVTGTSATPTGKVNFTVDGFVIGSANLSGGVATFTASSNGQAPGSYPIVAKYVGTTPYNPSSSSSKTVVLAKAATSTTFTATPSTVTPPDSVDLVATVTRTASGATGFATGTVTFEVGSQVIATVKLNASGAAGLSASTSGIPAGTYPVTAKYSGDSDDAASTSSAVSVTVK